MRDTREDRDYFEGVIAFYNEQVEKTIQNFDNYPNKRGCYRIIAEARLMNLFNGYSIGYPIEDLKIQFEPLIDSLIDYLTFPEVKMPLKDCLLDTYVDALGILSMAYLLKVDDQVFDKVLNYFDIVGTDKLIDQLIRFRQKDRKLNEKLIHKKYKPLSDFIEENNREIDFLFNYIKDWYKGMRPAIFYNSHNNKQGTQYTGYWCWEAACLVALLKIDDTTFRSLNVYPSDLVRYYKGEL